MQVPESAASRHPPGSSPCSPHLPIAGQHLKELDFFSGRRESCIVRPTASRLRINRYQQLLARAHKCLVCGDLQDAVGGRRLRGPFGAFLQRQEAHRSRVYQGGQVPAVAGLPQGQRCVHPASCVPASFSLTSQRPCETVRESFCSSLACRDRLLTRLKAH